MADVGFIGLGRMGRGMARNLVKAGHRVTVWNRSPGPAEELAAEGARRVTGPAEVARASTIVVSCLSTPEVVEEILTAPGGALEGAAAGSVFVDCSTIGPGDVRRMADRCAARGVALVDAPVSGGVWGAAEGTLTIMCGGDRSAYDQALPALEAMGKRIHHLGPSGTGQVAKLANNMLVAIHTAAAAEAFVLGVKGGVDPQALLDIIANSAGDSSQIRRCLPKFVFPGQFDAAFSIEHLHKDMGLACQLGRELQVRLLLGAVSEQLTGEAMAAGLGGEDVAALFKPVEKLAGTEVRVKPS